ncbi:pleckstrin homology domain-containing family A member 5 isoform X23 [Crotalus tigris]|uniref:pleckstrin homology domain-containing family A member 5 isoform X23 n=1 Tax=Crotalus tigris TaxID=88082 RepID=UPI00192F120C|nr:pleckstrin homology domain-containing family A member 5 isoform X23 [Crotalus tigris]
MAAELSAERLRSLPASWSFGISRGGRIFFINEEAKSTTWLHPLTGEAAITGHRRSPDLPTGWEEAYTFEGARYYINSCTIIHFIVDFFCKRQYLFLELSKLVSEKEKVRI